MACDALQLKYECVAKRNHKAVLLEKFNWFLKKAVIIAIGDRKTLGYFTKTGIFAEYAWNSVPINGTGVTRSILAIGWELKFHIDISSDYLLPLTSNQAYSVVKYLRLTDSSKHFTTEILKILIEGRRTVHRERINNSRKIVSFFAGNVTMARKEVQSNKSTNKVGKLCYQIRGPFTTVKSTRHGIYTVQRVGNQVSPQLNFMAEERYV